jgi:hypothetical protein
MDSIMSKGPEQVLEKTLKDLQIRAEVEATMQSMLIDVETTASLQQQVDTQSQLSSLQNQVSQYEIALQEAQAMQTLQREMQSTLADSLVQQLWTLSQELGQLRRWKETHETTVSEHDEVIAKLLQAEEQIRVLQSRPPAAQNADSKDYSTINATIAQVSISTDAIETDTALKETEEELDALLGNVDASENNNEDRGIQSEKQAAVETNDTVPTTSETNDASFKTNVSTDDNAVVSLLQEEEVPLPTLDTLNGKVLAEIFEFLDAVEILNTAQINITMYSRVDALFGLSGEAAALSESEQQPGAAAHVQPEPASVPPAEISAPTIASLPTVDAPAQLNRAPLTAGPPDAKLPAQSPSNNTTNSTPTTVAPARRGGIFSLLQARGSGASPGGTRRGTAATGQPLSAAMTDSMVSKLNDKELSAIFSLTEKLHQREKAVTTLTAEKEELAGKLDGMEGLKDFLIEKVRNVEQSLRKSREDEMKVAQQISSDQEVIAFLDGRVQELERDIKSLSDEKKTISETLNRIKIQNDKKIEVLGDMLQFERERVSENEREWKATKKLLVKEIKSCRAQLLALQAERDGFREQNERLKKAVLLTNPSNGGSM